MSSVPCLLSYTFLILQVDGGIQAYKEILGQMKRDYDMYKEIVGERIEYFQHEH